MATASESHAILVTGATGFIATHVIQQLLQDGHRVRGTVRSLSDEKKVNPLRQLCPGSRHALELVEANLSKADTWPAAVNGCSYVIHVASPVPHGTVKDEMEVIKPAVDGTLAVLEACKQVGGIKRVVLTSSVAAVISGRPNDITFTEEDWTDVEASTSSYSKSKTLAERAAWRFVENLPENDKFELSVLNPCFVMGPVLCGTYTASMQVTKQLLGGKLPALPYINFNIVDVRDVAKAHVIALHLHEAAGKRHILSSHNMWIKEIANAYREKFGPLGYSIPRFYAPYILMTRRAEPATGLRGQSEFCCKF